MLDSCRVKGWGTHLSSVERKSQRTACSWTPGCNLYKAHSNETWAVITQDLSRVQFAEHANFCRRMNNPHQQLKVEITKKKSQDSNKVLDIAWPAWTIVGLELTQLAWDGKLLHHLFHVKSTHIENCFCSVEQSLPLAKKARSLDWPSSPSKTPCPTSGAESDLPGLLDLLSAQAIIKYLLWSPPPSQTPWAWLP